MGNSFAYLALFAWPVVTLVLFTRLPAHSAVLWSLLAGFLLLPPKVAVDLPGLPPFDKTTIPSLSALLCALLVSGRDRPALLPREPIALALLALLLAGPVLTTLLNDDRLVYGPTTLPPLGLRDAVSAIVATLLMIIPFLLGRHYFATPERHRELLAVLMLAGLAYSLPMLFEVRMSPQLNIWTYGFFPHSWLQQERYGGYRPVVFLAHGLATAFFALLALGAAITLRRLAPERSLHTMWTRGILLLVLLYLVGVLVLTKTLSVYAYALFLVPVLLLAGPRTQMRLAALMVAATLLFPVLRANDLVPTTTLVGLAEAVDAERADSLAARFFNEDILLEKAQERPLFGWGEWGRNRVYDPVRGQDLSTTDGQWIVQFGSYGLVGFIGLFGLLALPVLRIWQRAPEEVPLATAGVAMLLAINMVNLLPNSTLLTLTWLMVGGLLGYAESLAPGRPARRRVGLTRAGPRPPEPDAAEAPAPAGIGTGQIGRAHV